MKLITTTTEQPVVQSITRIDRERAITITANPAPGHAQKEGIDFAQSLNSTMPQGYSIVLGGQSTQLQDTTSSLPLRCSGSAFSSRAHGAREPVQLVPPPGHGAHDSPARRPGAFVGLYLIHASLNIFSMIGVLLLMGIVKKNSIMLVEYANHIREVEDCDALMGMSKAGPIRLRPILMTTVATMMSAVPAVLGLGPGSETRGPMGAAILGGLTVSTVLSLLVVPAFYVVADRIRTRLFGKRHVIHIAPSDGSGEHAPHGQGAEHAEKPAPDTASHDASPEAPAAAPVVPEKPPADKPPSDAPPSEGPSTGPA